jgi:Uma2 family endonuclease
MSVVTELFSGLRNWESDPVLNRLKPKGLPVLYEDDGPKRGDSSLHTRTCDNLYYGLEFHFEPQAVYRVYRDLNIYYAADEPRAYVSPDVFVIKPKRAIAKHESSYDVGRDGPAPRVVMEVLSERSFQEDDLTTKPVLYAALGVEEYVLVDVTGEMLKERLLLLRRKSNGKWATEQDADGGVTSRLGFRIVIDTDGQVRVLNAKTRKAYARPEEAQQAAKDRDEAAERIRKLEEKLARLRGSKRTKK